MHCTSESFLHHTWIASPNVKAELPAVFDMHEHLFSAILLKWHDTTLQARKLAYTVEKIVKAVVFWRIHYWPVSCTVQDLQASTAKCWMGVLVYFLKLQRSCRNCRIPIAVNMNGMLQSIPAVINTCAIENSNYNL